MKITLDDISGGDVQNNFEWLTSIFEIKSLQSLVYLLEHSTTFSGSLPNINISPTASHDIVQLPNFERLSLLTSETYFSNSTQIEFFNTLGRSSKLRYIRLGNPSGTGWPSTSWWLWKGSANWKPDQTAKEWGVWRRNK
jgi:hypothetical protein